LLAVPLGLPEQTDIIHLPHEFFVAVLMVKPFNNQSLLMTREDWFLMHLLGLI